MRCCLFSLNPGFVAAAILLSNQRHVQIDLCKSPIKPLELEEDQPHAQMDFPVAWDCHRRLMIGEKGTVVVPLDRMLLTEGIFP
jgi:hypothetical protein